MKHFVLAIMVILCLGNVCLAGEPENKVVEAVNDAMVSDYAGIEALGIDKEWINQLKLLDQQMSTLSDHNRMVVYVFARTMYESARIDRIIDEAAADDEEKLTKQYIDTMAAYDGKMEIFSQIMKRYGDTLDDELLVIVNDKQKAKDLFEKHDKEHVNDVLMMAIEEYKLRMQLVTMSLTEKIERQLAPPPTTSL